MVQKLHSLLLLYINAHLALGQYKITSRTFTCPFAMPPANPHPTVPICLSPAFPIYQSSQSLPSPSPYLEGGRRREKEWRRNGEGRKEGREGKGKAIALFLCSLCTHTTYVWCLYLYLHCLTTKPLWACSMKLFLAVSVYIWVNILSRFGRFWVTLLPFFLAFACTVCRCTFAGLWRFGHYGARRVPRARRAATYNACLLPAIALW